MGARRARGAAVGGALHAVRETFAHAADDLRGGRFYGWRLLGALWAVMFLNLGFAAYGIPGVVNPAMAHALGLKRETLGDLFSVYLLMSGLPGPLVALGIERFGSRRMLTFGSALIAGGALAMTLWVANAAGAMLGYGVLVGAGVAAGSALAAQSTLARWFVRRRSLALALLYSASAVGGLVAAPLLERLIAWTGTWRAGFGLLFACASLAGLIAALGVRERPEELGQRADGAPAGNAEALRSRFITPTDWSTRAALRTGAYWMLLLSMAGCMSGYSLFIAHGVVHLQDLGHSMRLGAWAVGVMTATGLIGKAMLAVLGDRLDPRYLFAGFVAAFALGLLLLTDARGTMQAFGAVLLLGLGYGGGFVSLMAVLGNYFGSRAFTALSGLAIAVSTTVSALTPKLAGRLFDLGLGYTLAFHALAAWCLTGAVALALMRRPVAAALGAVRVVA